MPLSKRIIVKDKKLYLRLKKFFPRSVYFAGDGWVCPFCGQMRYPWTRHYLRTDGIKPRHSRLKLIMGHLKYACKKAPWYWVYRAKLFSRRWWIRNKRTWAPPDYGSGIIYIIIKQLTGMPLKKFCQNLLTKEKQNSKI